LKSAIRDDNASFAAVRNAAIPDTASTDALRLLTVEVVSLSRSIANCIAAMKDRLKLLTVDDKVVTFVAASSAIEEVFSSDELILSTRDPNWTDCIDSKLVCARTN